jgi:hypothetical protein
VSSLACFSSLWGELCDLNKLFHVEVHGLELAL